MEKVSTLVALAESLGIQDARITPLKFLKPKILTGFGFKAVKEKGNEVFTNFHLKDEGDSSTVDDIHNSINQQIVDRKSIVIRFISDGGVKSGGYPICYIGTQDEYQQACLVNQNGDFLGWQSTDDRIVKAIPPLHVQTIARDQSQTAVMRDLDNFPERQIRLGGGFRMMLDRITTDPPGFMMNTTMLFNDIGARCANLSSKYDLVIPPRVNLSIPTVLSPNGLSVEKNELSSTDFDQIINRASARDIARKVVSELFEMNREPLADFFNVLMRLSPMENLHMIDGVFSIKNNQLVILEAIDFDGEEVVNPLKTLAKGYFPSDEVKRLVAAHHAIMEDRAYQ